MDSPLAHCTPRPPYCCWPRRTTAVVATLTCLEISKISCNVGILGMTARSIIIGIKLRNENLLSAPAVNESAQLGILVLVIVSTVAACSHFASWRLRGVELVKFHFMSVVTIALCVDITMSGLGLFLLLHNTLETTDAWGNKNEDTLLAADLKESIDPYLMKKFWVSSSSGSYVPFQDCFL